MGFHWEKSKGGQVSSSEPIMETRFLVHMMLKKSDYDTKATVTWVLKSIKMQKLLK